MLKLSAVLGIACLAVGCSGGSGTTGTTTGPLSSSSSSTGGTSGNTGAVGYTFEAVRAGDDDPNSRGGLGLAVAPSGEIAVAYYVDINPQMQWTCVTPNDGMQMIDWRRLRLVAGTPGSFTTSTVEDVRSEEGVSLAYNGAGQLFAAYGGGPEGTGFCGASDLILRPLNAAGPGAPMTVAGDSGNGTMCRLMQDACNSGNVVGRFASLVFDESDTPIIAYKDTHFGFSQETDLDGSDLEVNVGAMRNTVDDSSGAGEFNVAFLADGRPAVAHVVTANHVFAGNVSWRSGVWLAWQQEDGTWLRSLVDDRDPDNAIGAAWSPTQGFAIAYQSPGNDELDLVVATSMDGMTWEREDVDFLGGTGLTPSVAFTGNRLLVAYRVCTGAETGDSRDCQPAEDGVRLATRQDGEWHFDWVYRDEERLEGQDLRLAIRGDGIPIVAFKDQGNGRVMVATGSRK